MKPLKSVLIWVAQLITLFFIYSLLCYMLPDLEIYSLYVEKYGFVMEENWLDVYTLIIFSVSFVLTTLLIWLVSRWYYKKQR